jgi:hypothetical protein
LTADLPPDSPHAIPSAARPRLVAELEARIYALEIVEEKLVLAAQAAGLDVQRRANASCWAILFTSDSDEEVPVAEAAE